MSEPGDDPPARVQIERVPGAEHLRGPGHPNKAGQAVLPGHHRAVRDEAAQLGHHAAQDGEVRGPADVSAQGDQDLPGSDVGRLRDVSDHPGGRRHLAGPRRGPRHGGLAQPRDGPLCCLEKLLLNLDRISRNNFWKLLLIPDWKKMLPSHCFSQQFASVDAGQ